MFAGSREMKLRQNRQAGAGCTLDPQHSVCGLEDCGKNG